MQEQKSDKAEASPPGGMLLRAENLGKRYESRWVLRGINLDLGPGDCLVVGGSNGSGKSTLLRLLAGLLSPSEGKVHLTGDPRTTLGLAALEFALYPTLTVREHLELTASLRGVTSRADELLEFIGLAYAADRPASQLSTGMKARLKFAIAIQARPLALLLDEPGAGLDEPGLELLARIIQEQLTRGCIVLATNDPRERRWANLELQLNH